MRIWGAVSATDPKHVKKVGQRGGFSAVCATYQIRQATELWGPMGTLWGPEDVVYEIVPTIEGASLVTCELNLAYPGGKVQAIKAACDFLTKGKFGLKADVEAWKKSRTNAITKALSQLGFAADVFLGLFDDNQYVQQHAAKMANEQGQRRTEQASAGPEQEKRRSDAPKPKTSRSTGQTSSKPPAPTPGSTSSPTPRSSPPVSSPPLDRSEERLLSDFPVPEGMDAESKAKWPKGVAYGLDAWDSLKPEQKAAQEIGPHMIRTLAGWGKQGKVWLKLAGRAS